MKKPITFSLYLLTLSTLFLFGACSQVDQPTSPIAEQVPTVGQIHNKVLAEFNAVHSFKSYPALSYDQFLDTMADIAVREYARYGYDLSRENAELMVDSARSKHRRLESLNIMGKSQSLDLELFRKELETAAVITVDEVDVVIDILGDLIVKDSVAPADVRSSIDTRLLQEEPLADDSDLAMALDVMYHSSVYWAENSPTEMKFPWRDIYIIASDATGGIIGGIVGGVAGPGGSVIGGGVGMAICSSIAAVQEF